MAGAATERHRRIHQSVSLATPANRIAQHEPAQVRLTWAALAIDDDRAVYMPAVDDEPHAVVSGIKAPGEFGELARDLGFEQHAEAVLAGVILPVQAADRADRTGQI